MGHAGCPLPKNPTSFWPQASAHRASPLTRNRGLGPSKHDGLDPPTPPNRALVMSPGILRRDISRRFTIIIIIIFYTPGSKDPRG